MKLIIGNDHGGYKAKMDILEHLKDSGHEILDIGCDSEDIVRYPNYAAEVAKAVLSGNADRGILICSTGIGMSIAANKFPGIHASMCTSHYMAKMTRQHNDSNVLCLGGKITGIYELQEIVDAWLENEYIGGRHDISLGLIKDIEAQLHKTGE